MLISQFRFFERKAHTRKNSKGKLIPIKKSQVKALGIGTLIGATALLSGKPAYRALKAGKKLRFMSNNWGVGNRLQVPLQMEMIRRGTARNIKRTVKPLTKHFKSFNIPKKIGKFDTDTKTMTYINTLKKWAADSEELIKTADPKAKIKLENFRSVLVKEGLEGGGINYLKVASATKAFKTVQISSRSGEPLVLATIGKNNNYGGALQLESLMINPKYMAKPNAESTKAVLSFMQELPNISKNLGYNGRVVGEPVAEANKFYNAISKKHKGKFVDVVDILDMDDRTKQWIREQNKGKKVMGRRIFIPEKD